MVSNQAGLGVHSEVGQLRKVLVCAPGRAHQRLTPSNCDALLFDDVMWVENAHRDHRAFVEQMRSRGVEVLEMHDLLAETVALPQARAWLLDHQVVPNQVGLGLVDEVRSYLDGLPDRDLAETLIGGLSTRRVPRDARRLDAAAGARGSRRHRVPAAAAAEHALHPRHHLLDLRRRHPQPAVLAGAPGGDAAHHGDLPVPPATSPARSTMWWGDPTSDWGLATLEGGDVMPIGNGIVLIGMSERTSRQAISQLAAALFEAGRAPSG